MVLTCGSVFSGIGLLDYGLHLAGLRHAWFCERDEFRRSVLAQRWPGARIADDVRHVGHGFQRVDVIAGGFPCKGASSAGKREGFGHPETVLWREMARAVRELRPRYVLVENVADILGLHDGEVWGEVVGTLAALGYDAVWDCLPAAAVGAPHGRDRVFAIATYSGSSGLGSREPDVRTGEPDAEGRSNGVATDADGPGRAGGRQPEYPGSERQRDIAHEVVAAVADASSRRCAACTPEHGSESARPYAHPVGRGVPVEWGPYGPAIRRWEAVHGPAPEPLVRRVDDRRTSRMERQRLSALGDGVQVQVGRIAGEYVMSLERERLRRAA